MGWQVAKFLIAAGTITFTSWLAGRQPRLAGFLMALPISSMLALAFFQLEYRESAKAALFAKSIALAVPLSLLFFVPFFFAERLQWPFFLLYGIGVALLLSGYFIHKAIF